MRASKFTWKRAAVLFLVVNEIRGVLTVAAVWPLVKHHFGL
jgi:hypothetical protein